MDPATNPYLFPLATDSLQLCLTDATISALETQMAAAGVDVATAQAAISAVQAAAANANSVQQVVSIIGGVLGKALGLITAL